MNMRLLLSVYGEPCRGPCLYRLECYGESVFKTRTGERQKKIRAQHSKKSHTNDLCINA